MLDFTWQTLSLWRRPRISQKPNVCALGRAGTFDAQTIKQAKQNKRSQLESTEEGSCNSSGCTSGLKFSPWCEQLYMSWRERTGVCLWVHNRVCGFAHDAGKVKLFSRTCWKRRGKYRWIRSEFLLKYWLSVCLLLSFFLFFPPHPSLPCAHNQPLRRQRVRRFLQTSACGSWTMWHVQAQHRNTTQKPF